MRASSFFLLALILLAAAARSTAQDGERAHAGQRYRDREMGSTDPDAQHQVTAASTEEIVAQAGRRAAELADAQYTAPFDLDWGTP